jgi:hypothetical protein
MTFPPYWQRLFIAWAYALLYVIRFLNPQFNGIFPAESFRRLTSFCLAAGAKNVLQSKPILEGTYAWMPSLESG